MADGKLSRRGFARRTVACAAGVLGAPAFLRAQAGGPGRSRIQALEPQGMLIRECGLNGEGRRDDVVPAHPNGIQVSRARWLLVYATRSFRGVDDDLSIIYQLRQGAPDGKLIREGALARTTNDWDPFNQGDRFVRQHGHPVAFGVPRGAKFGGKVPAHANLFVAKWRVVARTLDRKRNALVPEGDRKLTQRTQAVEWVQFRLNEREDDIEIVQPAAVLRQRGHEKGAAFCSAPVAWMNQSFTPTVPFNRDCTEWADCNHFDGGRVAALKYVFNPGRGRYDWVATGPFVGDPKRPLSEASLARVGDQWIIAARSSGGRVAWVRTENPFERLPAPVYPKEPVTNAPLTAFTCADSVLRLFTGSSPVSASRNARDPLFCWNINPADSFTASERRVIFDSVKAGLRIRPAAVPKIDMCKLLAPQGRTQLLVHRVSVRSFNHLYLRAGKPIGIPVINQEEKACCGIYYARITYADEVAGLWEF